MQNDKCEVKVFSPAKINLVLGVLGQRGDGYHDLISLVAKLNWGDTLHLTWDSAWTGIVLECDNSDVPLGEENLILKAARVFEQKYPIRGGVKICLQKRIPMGAGLGGGSSNAVATFKGLNKLFGQSFKLDKFLGSDCLLFQEPGLVEVFGRGDRVNFLEHRKSCSGQRVLVFKPGFGVDTCWGYHEFIKKPEYYVSESFVRMHMKAFFQSPRSDDDWVHYPFYNNFNSILMGKYLLYRFLVEGVRENFGLGCFISGSGSSCFIPLKEHQNTNTLMEYLKELLGNDVFIVETTLS